ncbi:MULTISPECIES: hypothetical protein [unclassified Desulfovibrio]|uniref:hypothetical protein n=1 Tax=unclassified Desulfovibrio TaxID=2593640 RepID=UPI002FDB50A8
MRVAAASTEKTKSIPRLAGHARRHFFLPERMPAVFYCRFLRKKRALAGKVQKANNGLIFLQTRPIEYM